MKNLSPKKKKKDKKIIRKVKSKKNSKKLKWMMIKSNKILSNINSNVVETQTNTETVPVSNRNESSMNKTTSNDSENDNKYSDNQEEDYSNEEADIFQMESDVECCNEEYLESESIQNLDSGYDQISNIHDNDDDLDIKIPKILNNLTFLSISP